MLLQLKTTQCQRITAFFTPMDAGILQGALARLEAELTRVQRLIPQVNNPDFLYEELTREWESTIRFAPAGVILNTEIQRYVERK